MEVIYKYSVKECWEEGLYLPRGYKILHLGLQNNQPYLWILRDHSIDAFGGGIDFEHVQFEYFGTGEQIDVENKEYIGTWQTENGFVYHLFKIIK